MVNKTLLKRCILMVGLFFSLLPALSYAAKITHIHTTNFNTYLRIVFNISDPDKYHVFTLQHPQRVIVDVANGYLKTNLQQLNRDTTDIVNVRSGRPVPNTLRIVFDMAGEVKTKSFVVTDNAAHEAQLVVDIYPKSIAFQTHTQKKLALKRKPIVITQTLSPPTPQQHAEIIKPHTIIVVVDPGHGGKDPGTVGPKGTKEKNVVLAVSMRLVGLINSQPNMHAVLTRNGDYFLTLRDRLNVSRQNKADMFIAIHADSYFDNQFSGAAVYALSPHSASSMAARWVADRENHSELDNVELNDLGDKSYVLRSVLVDLAERATIADSVKLGTNMLDALGQVTMLHYPHVEQAPFMVLKSPDIPSILIEMGFLSSPKEEEHLRDSAYRDKVARAMFEGVRSYIATHPMLAKN